MPWPKGQKRVGYIRKDGQAHQKWGESLPPQVAVRIQQLRSALKDTGTKNTPTRDSTSTLHRSSAKVSALRSKKDEGWGVQTETRVARRKYSTPLAHPQYSIEQCPNCDFPEADGGYCPDCGWSQPVIYGVAF